MDKIPPCSCHQKTSLGTPEHQVCKTPLLKGCECVGVRALLGGWGCLHPGLHRLGEFAHQFSPGWGYLYPVLHRLGVFVPQFSRDWGCLHPAGGVCTLVCMGTQPLGTQQDVLPAPLNMETPVLGQNSSQEKLLQLLRAASFQNKRHCHGDTACCSQDSYWE